jgi:16S rRNA (cytosine1402-N4)-methyltransferase
VLAEPVLALLAPCPGGRYLDGTLGGAGHTALVLAASAPEGRVLALDADPQALARAHAGLAGDERSGRLLLRHGNFASMATIARADDFLAVDGVLLDLGLSSDQLAEPERGFSFAADAPLDMRFDPTHGVPASELVNTLAEAALADLFWRYGEERRARAIARRIVAARVRAPIARTGELARLVAGVVHGRPGGIHPATRTFQALRIAVNDELSNLEAGLAAAVEILRPGGRLVVISFHSLEDRIVKRFFQAEQQGCICPPDLPACVCGHQPRLRTLTRHPITAGEAEVRSNPRSRSAKLRAAERTSPPARPPGRIRSVRSARASRCARADAFPMEGGGARSSNTLTAE